MFAINKNSYLQSGSSSVSPQILNRSVDRARGVQLIYDPFDFQPPFFRITSEQPDIPIDNVDITRRPLAFERWALPKLRRELHHKDETVVIQALTSICDLIRDPEKGHEAIRLKIPDRLADLLEESLAPIRERAVLALSILANLGDGRDAIIKNYMLVHNLKLCLGDSQPSVRMKTATCVEIIARSWVAADTLVEHEFIETLLQYIEDEYDEVLEVHLESLKLLMYGCGKCVALKNDAFRKFMNLLKHESSQILSRALDCLMILVSTKKGKQIAMQKNLLETLNKLIHYSDISVCTSAVSVIMFCTVKTKAKHLAVNIKPLVRRLIKLATNHLNFTLQMFCLKALTNICEHPLIRKEVREKYLENIETMQVGNNEELKNILLKVINWVPEKVE